MNAFGRLGPLPLCALLVVVASGASCNRRDSIQRLIGRLADPVQREAAIDRLLVAWRHSPKAARATAQRRIVDALCEAYREDVKREQIISALVLLRDPQATPVLISAVADAGRGGSYLESAIKAARLLGELGQVQAAPALARALRSSVRRARDDRNAPFERALATALEQLHDPRTVDALVDVVGANPLRQELVVAQLAVRALGRLGTARAAPALVGLLGATPHGALLVEESRRALCQVGPAALPSLREAITRRGPSADAAVSVLADLGLATEIDLPRPTDSAAFRLAVAEAIFRADRKRRKAAEALSLALLEQPEAALSVRRQAAVLLGWYGAGERVLPRLLALLAPPDKRARQRRMPEGDAKAVLTWSIGLAVSRLATQGSEVLDGLQSSVPNVDALAVRVRAMQRCGEAGASCHERLMTDRNWRIQERAALELGRQRPIEAEKLAFELVRYFRQPLVHGQVREALLSGLERLAPRLRGAEAWQLARLLEQPLRRAAEAVGDDDPRQRRHAPTPSLIARSLCLVQRLQRQSPPAAAGHTRPTP